MAWKLFLFFFKYQDELRATRKSGGSEKSLAVKQNFFLSLIAITWRVEAERKRTEINEANHDQRQSFSPHFTFIALRRKRKISRVVTNYPLDILIPSMFCVVALNWNRCWLCLSHNELI